MIWTRHATFLKALPYCKGKNFRDGETHESDTPPWLIQLGGCSVITVVADEPDFDFRVSACDEH